MSSVSQLLESDGILMLPLLMKRGRLVPGVQEMVVKVVNIELKVLVVMKAVIATYSKSDRLA